MSSPPNKRKHRDAGSEEESSIDETKTSSASSSDSFPAPTFVVKERKTPGVSICMTLLPEDFKPSENDVFCGRGRLCKNWPGNIAYRQLVQSKLTEYSKVNTKHLKSYILDDIVKSVREKAGIGGFVKKDEETGRWYEIGDFLAREKTSQCFRDALHEQYTSSAHAKNKRRKLKSAEILDVPSGTTGDLKPVAKSPRASPTISQVGLGEDQVSNFSMMDATVYAKFRGTRYTKQVFMSSIETQSYLYLLFLNCLSIGMQSYVINAVSY